MGGQRGFTLTELLVALTLGSLLVIGAGQLLLSTFHTFEQVDRLGRQQETLIYTATTLASRLRRPGAFDDPKDAFHLTCSGTPGECHCTVQDHLAAQPLASFEKLGEGTCLRDERLGEPNGNGALRVSLPLGPGGSDVAFHVTPRPNALHRDDQAQ